MPIQPFSGTDIKNYWELLNENNFSIDKKYFSRFVYTSLVSLLTTTPVARIEKHFKERAIQNTEIKNDPVFIIGHWRSGTTFLHYLMSKDKNFGYINNAQSVCPGIMFFPFGVNLIKMHIPDKRPMDNVITNWHSPQEEEFALGNLSEQSCYHWWSFPDKMKIYFEKYALLQNLSITEYTKFQNTYLDLIKKVSLVNNGKRLIIKNPVNTGRIPMLLALFPNAKFIYLHRHPRDVYFSTIKLHIKLLERFSLQIFDRKEIEKNVSCFYEKLLKKYEQDKSLIAKNNLIELSYENLINAPLENVEKIYSKLQIPNFGKSVTAFEKFIKTQKDYRPQIYTKRTTHIKQERVGKLVNV